MLVLLVRSKPAIAAGAGRVGTAKAKRRVRFIAGNNYSRILDKKGAGKIPQIQHP